MDLHVAVHVEVAQLVNVLVVELLDMDVSIRVVLHHCNSSEPFRPGNQCSFGKLWGHDELHSSSISDPVERHMVVVVAQKGSCVLHHLLDS